MRRSEREVKDTAEICGVLSECRCLRLGLIDGGRVYVVPVNFGFTYTDGKYAFYFHGAKSGRKAELLARNGYAGFETDTGYSLRSADCACGYTALFKSVIGGGRVTRLEDAEEKRAALAVIMEHAAGGKEWTFAPEQTDAAAVYRLDADELSCKRNV